MKKTTFLLLFINLLFSLSVFCQVPSYLWAASLGASGDDQSRSIAVDASGNTYIAGFFYSSSITFGTSTFTNQGNTDMYLLKLDPSGNVLWAKSAGGAGYEFGYGVAVDGSGNVYVTGNFTSTSIVFGSTTLSNSTGGLEEIFLVKYNSLGTQQWAVKAGSTGSDIAYAVTADAAGNVFLTGSYTGTVNFGTGNLISTSSTADSYLVKYNSAGIAQWARSGGGSATDQATGICSDPSGNIYISGNFSSSSVLFGTASGTNSASGNDVFTVKYDATGTVVWLKTFGGSSTEVSYGIAADQTGSVCVTGYFQSSPITFASSTLNNAGQPDIYIIKYNTNGTEQWAKSAGSTGVDVPYGITTDANNSIYITGNFGSPTLTFGSTVLTLTGTGRDLFIAKYNSSGAEQWATSSGGTFQDYGYSITSDIYGNIYSSGSYGSSSITFGSTTFGTSGSYDIYVTKMATCIPVMTSTSATQVCSGSLLSIPLTSSVASNYTWVATDNVNITGESTSTQTTSSLSNTLVSTSTSAEQVNYAITPLSLTGGCTGSTQNLVVTVNPTPYMTNSSSAVICSGNTLNIPLSSNVVSSYSWIAADNPNTTGESTTLQTATLVNNTIINNSTSAQTVNYSVTPSTALCTGLAQTITVTVNPNPVMTSTSSGTICSGASINIPFTSDISSNYSWQASNNPNIVGESITTQTSSVLNNSLINISTNAQTVIYTVIPSSSASGCIGASQIITVTVYTLPVVSFSGLSSTYYYNDLPSTLSGNPTGGTFFGTGITGTIFSPSIVGSGTFPITYSYTDANSCTNTTSQNTTILAQPAPPSICEVTVDTISDFNILYWDKTQYTYVDSFIIYRETTLNNFQRIGAVDDTAFSAFTDTARYLYPSFTGDPNLGTNRYKMQILDSSGNYSPLSLWHKTIFVNQTAGVFTFNDYSIEGQLIPIPQLNAYELWRDDNSTGAWHLLSSNASPPMNDPNYASFPNANWRILTNWSLSCSPTRSIINTTRSNIKHGASISIGINNISQDDETFIIYPNPVSSSFSIQSSKFKVKNLKLYNLLGEMIYQLELNCNNATIETDGFTKGIYTIEIESTNGKLFKKLIIQ